MFKKFYDLTVVAVYGHNDGASSICAIQKSISLLPGSNGLLLSLTKPINLPQSIQWMRIPPLDYEQYSRFMIYSLASFVSTEWCLTVQDDGFAISGENWSDEFFNFDFIGAPTQCSAKGEIFTIEFNWVTSPENSIVVLNGGFSLRSKRLLNTARDIGLITKIYDQQILNNEDVQLQIMLKTELEKSGIKFAPLDVAKKFAIEYMHPSFHKPSDFQKVFGVHKTYMRLTAQNKISYSRQGLGILGESEFLNWLRSLNYDVQLV